ncbi:MAG: hypothetical protein A3F12_08110 [Gammaproteobacteria bacterium RIFCSPHIGHO2_12_FULL_38_14]|nr:MAG: hypothetical protein A3F12_08110 [Gammaproteobacteria bacterium RIFCSPHIGHO2_12_FULL_38_14]
MKINLSWHELNSAQFEFNRPFTLKLNNADALDAESVARVLPKKRTVVFGIWQGRNVVAKLFFDAHRAKQHFENEINGTHILEQHHIPTPQLLYQGMSEDRRIYVLIFERIENSLPLETLFKNQKNEHDVLQLMKFMIQEIATQHVYGILQTDLHFKNFLIQHKKIYSLDGATVKVHPPLLPKPLSIQYAALFLAQLGVGHEEMQTTLFKHYAQLRGFLLKESDFTALFHHISAWNKKRLKNFKKKIMRSSSSFLPIHHHKTRGIVERSYLSTALEHFLNDPDAIFQDPSAIILKAGRSSTVSKITLDQKTFVIKRYNMKNIFHKIRRLFRTSRAKKSWYFSQILQLFGVKTATPVAFIEEKRFIFPGKSYFVMCYVDGVSANHFFSNHCDDDQKISLAVSEVKTLFHKLFRLKITQGDLKISNILIDAHETPVLIDLDGAKEHRFSRSLKRRFQKEFKRFLKNFDTRPELQEIFKKDYPHAWTSPPYTD